MGLIWKFDGKLYEKKDDNSEEKRVITDIDIGFSNPDAGEADVVIDDGTARVVLDIKGGSGGGGGTGGAVPLYQGLDKANRILITDEKGIVTASLSIKDLFQSVSNGKAKVAAAITDKGIPTAVDATFDVMAFNIRQIEGSKSRGNVITSYYGSNGMFTTVTFEEETIEFFIRTKMSAITNVTVKEKE